MINQSQLFLLRRASISERLEALIVWSDLVQQFGYLSPLGLATLLGSAVRRRIVATSATVPATSPGTAARRRTPATTATRYTHAPIVF